MHKLLEKYLKKVINEGVSREVFHYLNLKALVNMMKQNKIALSSHVGTTGDEIGSKNKFYFLSVTRSKFADVGYARGFFKSPMARIKFNGDRLNQKFKGGSVDYWNRRDFQQMQKDYPGSQPEDLMHRHLTDNEMEDRVYSDKPFIENFKNYVDEITFYIGDKKNLKYFTLDAAKEIINTGSQLGIPVYGFTDYKSFANNRINNAANQEILSINIEKTEDEVRDEEWVNKSERNKKIDYYFLNQVLALTLYDEKYMNDYDALKSAISNILNKYQLEADVEAVYSTVDDQMRRISYAYNANFSDVLSGVKSNIHNLSKNGFDQMNRKVLSMLTDHMRQLKVKNLNDLLLLKRSGLRPNGWPKLNFESSYKLMYTHGEGSEIDLTSPLDNMYYFYPYNMFPMEEDKDIYYQMSSNNKSIGEYMNLMINKYTLPALQRFFENASEGKIRILKK